MTAWPDENIELSPVITITIAALALLRPDGQGWQDRCMLRRSMQKGQERKWMAPNFSRREKMEDCTSFDEWSLNLALSRTDATDVSGDAISENFVTDEDT
jgi:hypothetical protein